MKKFCFSRFALGLVFLLPTVVLAEPTTTFRLGTDIQWRLMPLKKTLGQNVTAKQYPQGGIYGGLTLNEIVGIELGYQSSLSMNAKKRSLYDGDTYFSHEIAVNPDYYKTKTKSRIAGFYGNLVGSLPLSEEYRLKLIASVGVAYLKAKIDSHIDFHAMPLDVVTASNDFHFSKKSWVPKVNLGVEHMVCDNMGLRALFGWEKTSKFSGMNPTDSTGTLRTDRIASLKNSATLGLGVFYEF